MKQKLKLIAITSMLMLVSGMAIADDHACGKGKFDKAKWHAQGAELFEKHQARLHTMLQLSAAQEAAWLSLQAQIKPEDKAEHPDFDQLSKLNTLQRLDKLEAWDKERNKKLTQRGSAIRTFYAQLNDAQKKVFDENAMPPPPPNHGEAAQTHHD